ncbi:hypothetical protein ROLI_001640 [Roseobacter fucihabitans]|uniref:Uncharacterized protein n=1 Tax=Roseobacter fucihabitans TaxID=1537242 RepID=A0ABZ2BLW2_9RHOB|nr:hypothetical protein [Roseobacter litoralis]MBC6963414.1 hypothetical protein [Roseobacter litoralis]
MTPPPAPQSFETLRHAAIGFAQAASGNIWTDFNLHDPGVTLLEQTCFALSEVSYQATHETADLLTDEKGDIRFAPMSLFLPRQTLPGNPVTLLDIAAQLSEVPGIARVLISCGPRAGLLNVVIIPAGGSPDAARQDADIKAGARIMRAFRARRPLGCDIHRMRVAKRVSARLAGSVQITGTAIPERVAAEIYYHVSAILRGQATGHDTSVGATRKTVFDHPQTFLHAPSDQDGKVPNLEDHLASFRKIPGVIDISSFSLTRQIPVPKDGDAREDVHYLDLTLPDTVADIELELTLDGLPLKLDPSGILEEFVRVSADHIAHARHHLDGSDWILPAAGQRRNFDVASIDALLPGVYRAGLKSTPEAALMTQYRQAVNAHVDDMSATLRDLPRFLSASTDATTDDPAVQRRRIALLDVLIAHQGEEMPETLHAGLHSYRTAAERAAFELRWRLDYLTALPNLNRGRGTGPNGENPGAFLLKFRQLADLQHPRDLVQGLERLDLSLADGADRIDPDFARLDLMLPDNPFDMLVPHQPDAQPLDDAALRAASPWITQNTCPAELFILCADPRSFLVSQTADGDFAVFFDAQSPTHLYTCGRFETLEAATGFAQRLRASWKALHANAEGAYLIEDILLRNASSDFISNSATMVMTGWTARTGQATYRAYVTRLIETHAPAHMKIDALWMDPEAMARFEDLFDKFNSGSQDAKREIRALLADVKAGS